MKGLWPVLTLALAWTKISLVHAGTPIVPLLAKNQDHFFIEDNFVYSRLLKLARDRSYQQINRDRHTAAEVDRGTWEQDADGTLLLHFTRGGLRLHALLSGPFSITLDPPQKIDDLAAAASAIRRWLTESSNAAFAVDNLREITAAPVVISVDPKAESFHRAELETLARQIDDVVWTEQHQTYRLSVYKSGQFLLLVPRGATFQMADLPRVETEYRVPSGRRPPFYFAQVNGETFAREAGSWQKLR